MAANRQRLITIEEFSRIAANSDERLELIDGLLTSMPPPDRVRYDTHTRYHAQAG